MGETVVVRIHVGAKDRLAEIGKKEGLNTAEAFDHVLAAYDAPKDPPLKAESAKARAAAKKVSAAAQGSKSEQMRALREQRWTEMVNDRSAVTAAAIKAMSRSPLMDLCPICGAKPGEYHNARCLGSKAGKEVYEGRQGVTDAE